MAPSAGPATMGAMDTDEVLEIIKDAAERAITPRFRELATDQISEKKPGDFVTVADREAEQLITAELKARIPGVVVVGEEAAFDDLTLVSRLGNAGIAYAIDPVDGTGNFVQGSPKFAVMVAELRDGQATRAWIWQPEFDRAYIAEQGAGVTCNGRRLSRGPVPAVPRGGATGRGARQFDLGETVELAINPNRSAGFDYPELLEGQRDFFIYRRPMPWDHLPGALMLRELGGVTIDVFGKPYGSDYVAGQGIIISAASQELAQQVAAAWRGPGQA